MVARQCLLHPWHQRRPSATEAIAVGGITHGVGPPVVGWRRRVRESGGRGLGAAVAVAVASGGWGKVVAANIKGKPRNVLIRRERAAAKGNVGSGGGAQAVVPGVIGCAVALGVGGGPEQVSHAGKGLRRKGAAIAGAVLRPLGVRGGSAAAGGTALLGVRGVGSAVPSLPMRCLAAPHGS